MWRLAFSLSVLATVKALTVQNNGVVDEKNNAVVLEAPVEVSAPRQGRQFWSSLGSFQYPASTIPLTPGTMLCFTPAGSMALCGRGEAQRPFRQLGGGWPGGAGAGGWPGVGGGWPGVGGGYPPQGQYPGAGGQFPGAGGQYPGVGGQYPGAGGQYPGVGGQYPGAGGQYPGAGGQYPGGPGGAPPQGQYPGGGAPPQGQYPGGGGGGLPPPPPPSSGSGGVPVTDKPAPPQGPPGPGSSYPKNCGEGKYHPIRYNNNGTVAEEQERIDYDGQHPFRVVNGWPADQGEWPWIAALLNNGRQFCGGSLITDRHILTAAHCVAHMSKNDVANLKVRLGDHLIKTSGETEVFESAAARVVRHKEFTQQTLHKDVAIISLKTPVPADLPNVRSVCLAEGSETYAGKTGTVVGWGSIKEQGPQPDELREVTVNIWDNKECKDTYGNAAPGGIMDHMLCAGQKGKDSCSGDSGGPMQIGSGPSWTQIGIVSWGIGCGKSHYPGVYTRVTAVRDWIDKIVADY